MEHSQSHTENKKHQVVLTILDNNPQDLNRIDQYWLLDRKQATVLREFAHSKISLVIYSYFPFAKEAGP